MKKLINVQYFENHIRQNKKVFILFTILRISVIFVLIRSLFLKNYEGVGISAFVLFLFLMPAILEKNFRVDIPPLFECIIYAFIYAAEIFVSCITVRGTMPKTIIWCSWPLHLCCALFLLGYLHRTGYISSGFEWSEELGHGNFAYHTEPASCWNIFWWLGGIRLTVLQIFHLWWHR